MKKCFGKRVMALGLSMVLAAGPLAAPVRADIQNGSYAMNLPASGEIMVNPGIHYQTLDGWGTSLCWWGNIIGSAVGKDYNNNGREDREEIAELAFSPEYLNLNMVRYNVGGGDKEKSSIKRIEGLVPGWSKDMYGNEDGTGSFLGDAFYQKPADKMNDAGQIYMLEKANEYRQAEGDIVNEVFSNSPPYYMTKSGSSTGGNDWDKENLKWEYYDDFAGYMAKAVKWLNRDLSEKFGSKVHYVEPLNEPDTNYWINGSTKQEGCIFWPGNSQNNMYAEMQKALDAEGLTDVKMTGTDETSLGAAINSFKKLNNDTKKMLDTISAHTYSGSDQERSDLKKLAETYDKDLWMSEVTKGGGSHNEDSHNSMDAVNTRSQSEGIMSDLKKMGASAWMAWLLADSEYECLQTDSNWGLLHYVFEEDGPVPGYHTNLLNADETPKEGVPESGYWAITKQFYTMMQYSKFLKAGYTMIDIKDKNMCAAISPDRKELVIVAQNFGSDRSTTLDLSHFDAASNVKQYRTSDLENCQEVDANTQNLLLKKMLEEATTETTETTEVTEATEATETTETSEENSETTTEVPETGSTAGATEAPETGSTTGTTEAPETGSTAGATEAPETGSTAGATEAPETGSTAGATEAPETGSTAGAAEVPETGSTEEAAKTPETQETGLLNHIASVGMDSVSGSAVALDRMSGLPETQPLLQNQVLTAELPANSVTTYVITADNQAPLYENTSYAVTVDADIEATADTIAAGGNDMDKFTYNGEWSNGYGIVEKWTQSKGASAVFKFTGNQAVLYGKKSTNGAELLVSVDGGEAVKVSAYADTTQRRSRIYATPALGEGEHTITISMEPTQTAQSPEIVLEYAQIIRGSMTDMDLGSKVQPSEPVCTAFSVIPDLPEEVSVELADGQLVAKEVNWNMTKENFQVEPYTKVLVEGIIKGIEEKATAEVLVVPENLQYFITCNNADSAVYQQVNRAAGLLNQTADPKFTDLNMGYLEEYGSYDSDDQDWMNHGWFAKKNQNISYTLPMVAGKYSTTFGFREWWEVSARRMKVTASYDQNGEKKIIKLAEPAVYGKNDTELVSADLELPVDADVTFTISKSGDTDPVMSFFSVAKRLDHSKLYLAIEQAGASDQLPYTTEEWNALLALVDEGRKELLSSSATQAGSDAKAAAIAAATKDQGSSDLGVTKEQLIENDYLLYVADCGTPDASVVPEGIKLGLYQSRTDQVYAKDSTGRSWGASPNDANSKLIKNGKLATDMAATFVNIAPESKFEANKSGIKYHFELPYGKYEVILGFQNPWSSRKVDVKLEGKTVDADLNLVEDRLIEKVHQVTVADKELDVMVHSPNRSDQYGDPVLNYILVKAVPDYTLQVLANAIARMDAAMTSKTYSEISKEDYDAAKQAASLLIETDEKDTKAIEKAYWELSNAYSNLVEVKKFASFTGANGAKMYDTNGKTIQAHGGQIQQFTVDGVTKYYWVGEDKTYDYRPVGGIHVYSSTDLYNWKDEGVALQTMSTMSEFETDPYFKELYKDYDQKKKEEIFIDLDKNNCVMERPKMLYNEKTKQYVIWFHADGRFPGSDADYGKAKAGVAVADSPAGPFKLLGSYKLHYTGTESNPGRQGYDGWNGRGSVRDMNLFVDKDKTAYVIYSSQGNETTFISKLNDTYTALETPPDQAKEGVDFTTNFVGWSREAPAMFRYGDQYYMINSGCTGWSPNPAQYMVADHPMGPWEAKGDPCVGENSNTTFQTQSTCVIPVDEENGKFIYMGDRWFADDLSESRYVWLPIEFKGNDEMVLRPYKDWTLEDLNHLGKLEILTELPVEAPSLEQLNLPSTIRMNLGGVLEEAAPVTWTKEENGSQQYGDFTFTGRLTKSGRTFSHTVTIVPEGTVVNQSTRYFIDCGSEESTYFDQVKKEVPALINDAPDQAYNEEQGYGYISEAEEEIDVHDGRGIFETGWYAKDGKAIAYQFDLKPGEYSVNAGYQEWWNTNRNMKMSVQTETKDGEVVNLAEKKFTLKQDDKANLETLAFTVPEDAKQSVVIKVEKTDRSADPVLSFLSIHQEGEQPVDTYSLQVVNGSGSGSYSKGTKVKITANAAPKGQHFTSWTAEGVTIAEPKKAEITLEMPGNDVKLTANYEKDSSGGGSTGGSTGGSSGGTSGGSQGGSSTTDKPSQPDTSKPDTDKSDTGKPDDKNTQTDENSDVTVSVDTKKKADGSRVVTAVFKDKDGGRLTVKTARNSKGKVTAQSASLKGLKEQTKVSKGICTVTFSLPKELIAEAYQNTKKTLPISLELPETMLKKQLAKKSITKVLVKLSMPASLDKAEAAAIKKVVLPKSVWNAAKKNKKALVITIKSQQGSYSWTYGKEEMGKAGDYKQDNLAVAMKFAKSVTVQTNQSKKSVKTKGQIIQLAQEGRYSCPAALQITYTGAVDKKAALYLYGYDEAKKQLTKLPAGSYRVVSGKTIIIQASKGMTYLATTKQLIK